MLTDEQAQQLGKYVYVLMNGTEWSSDTLQAIADYADVALGMPFSEPED